MLEAGRVARLAFLDDGDRPRVLPVTYAVAGGAVWSAIDDKPKRAGEPARVRYLRRRPEAALCVDRYDSPGCSCSAGWTCWTRPTGRRGWRR